MDYEYQERIAICMFDGKLSESKSIDIANQEKSSINYLKQRIKALEVDQRTKCSLIPKRSPMLDRKTISTGDY